MLNFFPVLKCSDSMSTKVINLKKENHMLFFFHFAPLQVSKAIILGGECRVF